MHGQCSNVQKLIHSDVYTVTLKIFEHSLFYENVQLFKMAESSDASPPTSLGSVRPLTLSSKHCERTQSDFEVGHVQDTAPSPRLQDDMRDLVSSIDLLTCKH